LSSFAARSVSAAATFSDTAL